MLAVSSPHCACVTLSFSFFFFNDTATTEIYTLSLHDALPISVLLGQGEFESGGARPAGAPGRRLRHRLGRRVGARAGGRRRSEEHTSELQSQSNLVCRLLLEKKKNGT